MDETTKKRLEEKLRIMIEQCKQTRNQENQPKLKPALTGTVIRRRKGSPDKRIL